MKVRFFLKRVLQDIELFLMQSSIDAQRITALGASPEKVIDVGNIKFDQVMYAQQNIDPEAIRNQFGIPADIKVIVAGSTHPSEEYLFIQAMKSVIRESNTRILPVIAPRHLNRIGEIEDILDAHEISWLRRSAFQDGSDDRLQKCFKSGSPWYILDTLGELAKFYAIAEIVFIGGSFAAIGGHNILEPAVFGVPVCFGPHMENFAEIRNMFIAEQAAQEVHSGEEMSKFMQMLLREPEKRYQMGKKAWEIVQKNCGATEKTFRLLESWIRKKQS